MKISDVIKWYWHSNAGWDATEYVGTIIGSRVVRLGSPDGSKVLVYDVLLVDGSLCEVREDAGLEKITCG